MSRRSPALVPALDDDRLIQFAGRLSWKGLHAPVIREIVLVMQLT
jgi:hypothetical protein